MRGTLLPIKRIWTLATQCKHCPLRRKSVFAPMTDEQVADMQRFKIGELTVDAGSTILLEGSNSPQLFTALHGMGLRYRHLENGERQVLNFIYPGDFLDGRDGSLRDGDNQDDFVRLRPCKSMALYQGGT